MRTRRERDIARETRKKRGNRRYGQAKLRPSRKGIFSCILSAAVLVLLVILILVSFLHKGQSPAIVGSLGLFGVIIAGIGLVTRIRGFRERDKNYLTCKIGIGISGFVLLCFAATFVRGLIG